MQGIVFDIKRFAVHDGPGIRTTVFLKGCPLKCFWCHNPESIDIHPEQSIKKIKLDDFVFDKQEEVGTSMSVDQIIDIVKKDRIFMEESEGGVTFSGGEPTLQPAYLLQLLQACKNEGFHTAVDTCGYTSKQTFSDIAPYTDLVLFDLKHYDSNMHKTATGQNNILILENLKYLLEIGKKVRIRIPIIPGFNYSDIDLLGTLSLLKTLQGEIEQIDLLPYHTLATNKYKRFGINNTMNEMKGLKKTDLYKAKEMYEKEGFRVKIGG
jgi:pyruvate formate lyase activating enzyme